MRLPEQFSDGHDPPVPSQPLEANSEETLGGERANTMQVQRPVHLSSHAGQQSADPKHYQTNGVSPSTERKHSASTNGHSNGEIMNNPYQLQYTSSQDESPQRQYPPNQLPPLQHPGMNVNAIAPGMAPSGSAAQTAMYPPTHALQVAPPPPMQPRQQQALARIGSTDKYTYELRVEQQPQRARMCGFGDKDRRPMTPPPAVLLVITHKDSGELVDMSDIEGSYFVLSVDLWDADATAEQNIVRSSSSSPAVSISSATTTSYPPTQERPPVTEYHHVMGMGYDGQPVLQPLQGGYGPGMNRGYPAPGNPYGYVSSYGGVPPGGHPQHMYPQTPGPPPGQANANMFTKNLIGSLTVNASILKDLNGQLGFWFVLQDLSVRTEGFFR